MSHHLVYALAPSRIYCGSFIEQKQRAVWHLWHVWKCCQNLFNLFGIYTVQYSCWNHHDVTTDIPVYSVLSIPRGCDWRATSYDGRIWADRSTGPDPTLWRAIWPGIGDNIVNQFCILSVLVKKTIKFLQISLYHKIYYLE